MPEDTEGDEVVAAAAGRRVLVLERTVRSGNVVRFAGDVTIFGDVNAGAHIEADGNIIVLGALRGLAHAGARGDENALIIAFELDAPQLRIARNFGLSEETEPPASLLDAPASLRGRIPVGQLAQLLRRDRVETRQYHPKIVWIQHGTIHIETYDGRLPI
jgi:septum site-determining protein MinC